ncbi:transcriptional regulator YeiL [Metasolibacillus meyeri]|uniref:Transcriptional regulator YeiL n=1 Tax=Metasolibacillus meyeri TaxID=1071052 RepID=A0AAW9NJ30_9BACL|nr:transcriptional regulator YeiL [Metasolibacillus meyeri]MEC1177082.1 transcriptional regulator YeiL [Metasolibacillus meyeri]
MQNIQNEEKQYYLEHFPIQHLFSFDIMNLVEVHHFERGEWIIKEGNFPQYLYFLAEGKAKIYMTQENGKVALISFAQPNAFIGELELLDEDYYSKGVQTMTTTICLALPIAKCKNELLADVVFLRYLCTFLGNKTSLMTAKFSKSLAYPLENRLAEFIILSAHNDIYKEKHTEVCDYLGVSYRHLLHVLSQFCEQGLLEKRGRSYVIIDMDALKKRAITTSI